MSCISIQKKPTLWGELLMVFINNSYEYESYHSKAPMVRLKLISKQKTISIPSFQFLMVRLKVAFKVFCSCN